MTLLSENSHAPRQVTDADVDATLLRVERGESNVEDANLLRAHIQGLASRVRVYEYGDDDHEPGERQDEYTTFRHGEKVDLG